MVAATILFHALTGATFGFAFGQYQLQLQNQFRWTKEAISGAFGVAQAVTGFLSPVHGLLIDRWGPRTLARLGILLLGFGFIGLTFVTTLWGLFIAMMVLASGAALAGWLTFTAAISNWFLRRRAQALGLSTTGIGLAGAFGPLVAWSIVTHGWEKTSFGSGIAVLVIGLPLAQLFRSHPEKYGLLPDGRSPERVEPRMESRASLPGSEQDFTVLEALRDRSFWFISLGHGFALAAVFAVIAHLIPYLVESHGWSPTSAQAMFTFVTLTAVIGQVGGGFAGDRFSKTRIAGVCMLGHFVAMLMLVVADTPAVIALAAFTHGVSWGTRGPLMIAIRADFYGRRNFGKIIGASNVIVMLGPFIGPWFAGRLNDRYGNYDLAFTTIGLVVGASSLFFFWARKPGRPRRPARGHDWHNDASIGA